jgi:hypothetical protein
MERRETRRHLENPTSVTFHLGTQSFQSFILNFHKNNKERVGSSGGILCELWATSARANTEGQVARRKVKGSQYGNTD